MYRAMVAALLAMTLISPSQGQSLRGSPASVNRMYSQAQRHDYTFLSTSRDVTRFVRHGLLVRLRGNQNYVVIGSVEFPYVRPATKLFIERLSAQYRAACGERLVVTSATRPQSRPPWNGSLKSVHPTGMAVDLRLPPGRCRSWLEVTLLDLEGRGVIEATRETRPPHYHVAVFSRQYEAYVASRTRRTVNYTVRRGDTLSEIAQAHRTTTAAIQTANSLRSTRILVGQRLVIPQ